MPLLICPRCLGTNIIVVEQQMRGRREKKGKYRCMNCCKDYERNELKEHKEEPCPC